MKVLFDHNLPHNLRTNFILRSNREIITASYLGWSGLTNGELLRRAEQDGFEVFVTGDQRLISEQSLTGRRLAVIALPSNSRPIIKAHLPTILAAIKGVSPDSIKLVECGSVTRKNTPD